MSAENSMVEGERRWAEESNRTDIEHRGKEICTCPKQKSNKHMNKTNQHNNEQKWVKQDFNAPQQELNRWDEKLKKLVVDFSAEDDFINREGFAEFLINNLSPFIAHAVAEENARIVRELNKIPVLNSKRASFRDEALLAITQKE